MADEERGTGPAITLRVAGAGRTFETKLVGANWRDVGLDFGSMIEALDWPGPDQPIEIEVRIEPPRPTASEVAPNQAAFEDAYTAGNRMAWSQILTLAIRHLGEDGRTRAGYLAERTEALQQLESLWHELGEAHAFPRELHLADIVRNLGKRIPR